MIRKESGLAGFMTKDCHHVAVIDYSTVSTVGYDTTTNTTTAICHADKINSNRMVCADPRRPL